MTNQVTLNSYFQVTPDFSELRRIFIYDPEMRQAYFDHLPRDTDQFITSCCGARLYIRPNKPSSYVFPQITTNQGVSLIKSNLQKAVRRKMLDVAISSTMYMLQENPVELLRRLPIIMIEDVCAMDCYPIVIWLMMACSSKSNYTLTKEDKYIVLQIVNNLCIVNEVYEPTNNENMIEWTHKMIEKERYKNGNVVTDVCLCLMYRQMYGGMKGDMKLINGAIYYFQKLCNTMGEIKPTNWELTLKIPHTLEIINEAIDFHTHPQMLKILSVKTGICESEIKHVIWTVESGVNVRKKYTQIMSLECKKTNVWELLRYNLYEYRSGIHKP
jgi:hypothetical protein